MGFCMSVFCGNVTRDFDLKETNSDNPMAIATSDLGVDTGYGDKKKANYFHLKAFGKTAQNMAKHVKKGTKIMVRCEPNQERWQGKNGKWHVTEFHYVQEWWFAESKHEASGSSEQPQEDQQKTKVSKSKPKLQEPKAKPQQAKVEPQPQPEPEPQTPPPQPTYHQPWMDMPDDFDTPFV